MKYFDADFKYRRKEYGCEAKVGGHWMLFDNVDEAYDYWVKWSLEHNRA